MITFKPGAKMLTQEPGKEEPTIASSLRGQVLAALVAVPMDRAQLFEVVIRRGQRGRFSLARRSKAVEQAPVGFLDSLAILQADGLISRTAHPLEDRRLYYLTEKGSALAKRVVIRPHRKVVRGRAEQVGS
jgi:hypothetical protein